MDGTLLDDEKRLSERNRAALKACLDRGIYIVPATGRPAGGIPEAVCSIPGIRYGILTNGAKVAESSQLCNLLRRFLFMAILQALFPAFNANARNRAISDSRRLCDLWPTADKRKQMPATKPPDSIRRASATDTNLFH